VADVLGSARLSHSLADVAVVTYDLGARRPFCFRSRDARAAADGDFLAADVARAAIAAPSFFAPAYTRPAGASAGRWLVDGGIFANDPALIGLAEAARRAPGDSDAVVLSLGTGEVGSPIDGRAAVGWGAPRWLSPIFEATSSGAADELSDDLQAVMGRPGGRARLWRLQARLTAVEAAMDDISDAHLAALEAAARALIAANTADLDALCEALT
jgi:predicted acylesterase/phospholipase RssA